MTPKPNRRQRMDGLELLRGLDAGGTSLAVFDPQYRQVLDKLKFGNEGARQSARARLPQMSDDLIMDFLRGIERALRPGGHVGLWIDKFSLGEGRHLALMAAVPQIVRVELICWNTLGFGMGRRGRTSCEYLVVAQKKPVRAAGEWTDHGIRDCWSERVEQPTHPHQKPAELTRRLITAVTEPGALVVDPAAGSYGVLAACKETGRNFNGCDLV